MGEVIVLFYNVVVTFRARPDPHAPFSINGAVEAGQ